MHLLIYIQIFLAVLLVVGILLQNTSAALGSAFGGGDESETFHTRRGLEKTVFIGTGIIAVLFVIVSFSVFLLS